ncbi:MAG: flagellar motor protein MotB, partial [Pseudomonadota bacterium]
MVKSSRPRGSLIETSENSDRWLISYADLITLLFAFFVVMYSTASINEGKMRVLSDSLVASFTGRNKTLAPIQVGKLSRSPYVDEEAPATTAEELVLIPARAGLQIARPNRPASCPAGKPASWSAQ